MTLSVKEAAQGRWTVLHVTGELDLVTSPDVRRRVHEAVAEGHHRVVVDLSDVYFCDSSGVGVLIAARRLLRSCQGSLRIVLPDGGLTDGSHVNRVLTALGVRRMFEIFPDAEAATDDQAEPLPVRVH